MARNKTSKFGAAEGLFEMEKQVEAICHEAYKF
mgnify:CR=1 FL=1